MGPPKVWIIVLDEKDGVVWGMIGNEMVETGENRSQTEVWLLRVAEKWGGSINGMWG